MTPDYFASIRYLMIEANSACNLACQFCNRPRLESQGLRKQKIVTPDEFEQLLKVFLQCPIDTIKFEGLSEPMLHPQFDRLCEQLRNCFPKAFIIVATNLQYRLERTPFLRMLPHVDMVYLSLDGVGETYERLRTGAKWHVAERTLSDIAQLVSAKERSQKLHINSTVTCDNVDQLQALYGLRDSFGLASVRINLAQNWNEDELNALVVDEQMLNHLRQYKQDVKGVGGWEFKECFWPFHGIVVDVFGDVRQCVINTSMTPLGNVFRDDIREVYNRGRQYEITRRMLQSNVPGPHCKTCDYAFLSPILEKLFEGKHIVNQPRLPELQNTT